MKRDRRVENHEKLLSNLEETLRHKDFEAFLELWSNEEREGDMADHLGE